MDLEHDLARRLRDGAASVSARADLDEVFSGASGRRRRTRRLSIGGAVAVVAIGVGGVFLVADRDMTDVDRSSAAPPTADGAAPGAAPAATDATAPDGERGTDGTSPESGEDAPLVETTVRPVGAPVTGPDPADEYLADTTEIYRRTMPSGDTVAVRLSEETFGNLFQIGWDAPTGSAELCLGHPVAFIGGASRSPEWPSAWAARQWFPLDPDHEVHSEEFYLGTDTSFVLVRTPLPAIEVTVAGGGLIADRAAVVGGVAILEVAYDDIVQAGDAGEQPTLTLITDPAFSASPEHVEFPLYAQMQPAALLDPACQPPPPPSATLPPPGEQPVDPAATEAEIRARHALLVDQTVAPEDKPEGLLDDDTGVTEAREQMEAGEYAESAAGAVYTLEEFVFTDPETAWFRYSIDAPTGLFSNRFGQATFNGEVWQITRQTICQDLTLAWGYCDGSGNPTPNLSPVDDADAAALWREWEQLSELYWRAQGCDPLIC